MNYSKLIEDCTKGIERAEKRIEEIKNQTGGKVVRDKAYHSVAVRFSTLREYLVTRQQRNAS